MALSVFPWKNKGEAEPTKLNRQNLNAAEEALAAQVSSGAIPLPASVVSSSAIAKGKVARTTGSSAYAWGNPLSIDAELDFGVKADLVGTNEAAMSATVKPTWLTVTGYVFTAANVGQYVRVKGAGVAGAELTSKIEGINEGNAVLATAASTTVSKAQAIFATDNTTALEELTTALGTVAPPIARMCILPQGTIMAKRVLAPRFGGFYGSALEFQGTGNVLGEFNNWQGGGSTTFYRMWGQTEDFMRFHESSSGSGLWAGSIAGFAVQDDPTNTAGRGVSWRNEAGTKLWIVDGAHVRSIEVMGFPSIGMEIPGGAVPGVFKELRLLANGLVDESAGLVYTTHGSDTVLFQSISGDQNKGGLLRLVGNHSSDAATFTLVNIKSEFAKQVYRDPKEELAPQQQNAVIFDNLAAAGVSVFGLGHHADGNSAGTEIGAAMLVTKTSASPSLLWSTIMTTVQAPQTQGLALEDLNTGTTFQAQGSAAKVSGRGEYPAEPITSAPIYRSSTGGGIILKTSTEATQGAWDFLDSGQGGFGVHIVAGEGNNETALIGLGTDYGTASGILIAMKNEGTAGLTISQTPNSSGTAIQVTAESSKNFAMRVNLSANSEPILIVNEEFASFPDGVTKQGSKILKSATAAFVGGDVGKAVKQVTLTKTNGEGVIPSGTTIAAVISGTEAEMSLAAAGSASGNTSVGFRVSGRKPSGNIPNIKFLPLASQVIIQAQRSTDTKARLSLFDSGAMQLGPGGSSTVDTQWARSGVSIMAVTAASGSEKAGLKIGAGVTLFSGAGAPGTIANSSKGDLYINSEGGALTTIYQRGASTSTWTGIV